MFKPLSRNVKGFKRAIIILQQAQDYRTLTFAMSSSSPNRLILKHPLRPGTFASSLLLLVLSRRPVSFGQRLSLAVHDER